MNSTLQRSGPDKVHPPRVLIIDDEPLIREVVELILGTHDIPVESVSGGREGIRLVSARPAEVDIAIIDFTMPDLNGYQTFLELQRVKPDLRVIFLSGHHASPELEALRQRGLAAVLAKPFEISELLTAVLTQGAGG